MILGIDPGTWVTGYGLLDSSVPNYHVIDYGCIRPPKSCEPYERYVCIFEGVSMLIEKHAPEVVVVETQFVRKNPQTALKLGMARGAVIVAAGRYIPVVEYPPAKAKLALVGKGNASKGQVQMMVKSLFNLSKNPPEDAADALALAVCHAHRMRRSAHV